MINHVYFLMYILLSYDNVMYYRKGNMTIHFFGGLMGNLP